VHGEESQTFKLFGIVCIKNTGELKMPKLARDFFAELELSRVEMLRWLRFPWG
jgi:hypothetical protein